MLPISPFTETSGTFVNAEGCWQNFEGVIVPKGETRPAWKVLRVLGNLFGCEGFDHVHSQEVRDEVRGLVGATEMKNSMPWKCPLSLPGKSEGIELIPTRNMYATDAILRRAGSLQAVINDQSTISIHSQLADKYGFTVGEQLVAKSAHGEVSLPLAIDDSIPDGCAALPAEYLGSAIGHRDNCVVQLIKTS
jgi:NADH-quinone oxidoreductase subunit G